MNYNNTPLPRILNARDPVTGLKLVKFNKRQKKYRPNQHIPVCRSGEEHLVENYDLAKKDDFKGWVLHHRLELTLDGQFANSAMDLVNKDMYFHRPHFELIWMKIGEHTSLHNSGDKNPTYGRTGDKHPMHGLICDMNPNWKGDDIKSNRGKRRRAHNAKIRALRNLQNGSLANTDLILDTGESVSHCNIQVLCEQ